MKEAFNLRLSDLKTKQYCVFTIVLWNGKLYQSEQDEIGEFYRFLMQCLHLFVEKTLSRKLKDENILLSINSLFLVRNASNFQECLPHEIDTF